MAAKKKKKVTKTLAVKIDPATSKEIARLRKAGYGVFIDKHGKIMKFELHPKKLLDRDDLDERNEQEHS